MLSASRAMSRTLITPVIRGHIDLFQSDECGQARLRGWIFREDTAIEKIDITLGGEPWTLAAPLHERPDVKTAFEPVISSCRYVSQSGFDVTAPLPKGVEANSRTIVGIVPYTPQGLRLDALQTHFFSCEGELNKPQPPVYFQERVGGSKDFVSMGANAASLVLTYIGKYKPICESDMILDWGCGCGRVITQMMKFVQPERLHGCDIDGAAIAWNKQNIPGPGFTRIEPYPPTPYSDGTFDVVYGISVMTHLDEPTQLRWLEHFK